MKTADEEFDQDIVETAIFKTGNGERGTGNGERRTGNGERGTGNEERGTGNGERGTGNVIFLKPYVLCQLCSCTMY